MIFAYLLSVSIAFSPAYGQISLSNAANKVIEQAQAGNSKYQFMLGIMYLKGIQVQKDSKQAYSWLAKAAEAGNSKAQYQVGNLYLNGIGTRKDKRVAFNWFEKAANQGIAKAQYMTGLMYATGRGTHKDEETAKQWFKKASSNGNAKAASYLSKLKSISEGKQIAKYGDMSKTPMNELRQIAEGENAAAQCEMGRRFHFSARKETTNYLKAANWYRKAFKNGSYNAADNLGVLYSQGKGVPKNLSKAHQLHKIAADNGFTNAKVNLGIELINGWGCQKDIEKAISYFRQASEENSLKGSLELAGILNSGLFGVSKNPKEAEKLVKKFAIQGDYDAQRVLAVSYNNQGNISKAIYWFKKSAKQGDLTAKINYALLQHKKKKYKQAFPAFYAVAINKHSHPKTRLRACKIVGEYYELGRAVDCNIPEALYWYRKAAALGDNFSKVKLSNTYVNGQKALKAFPLNIQFMQQCKIADKKSKSMESAANAKLVWAYFNDVSKQDRDELKAKLQAMINARTEKIKKWVDKNVPIVHKEFYKIVADELSVLGLETAHYDTKGWKNWLDITPSILERFD